jgi:D-sedoheptulose 7-phosphate isomerase
MRQRIADYFATLARLTVAAEATDVAGNHVALDDVFGAVMARAQAAHAGGNKVMFVGNGGSAAIASHMAIDYTKNGGIRALAFNDGAALTCLGNDLGYAQVFARQIEMQARAGDLLIAISSSGNSANILAAVEAARGRGCEVVTFSGFRPDNKLRALGDYNLYVASEDYGFVEVAHLALNHAILDLAMGWGAGEADGDRVIAMEATA